ncbi:sulfatase-like hydrolase/transferase [Helcococcus bovis]|uniref:sulfatase family protein n=1 Tax=Helcococcus bovis TaxID=3153252 RepID=UPI0038B72808
MKENLKGSKPNILLIISDDHGYGDVSFRGVNEDVNTPNLDRLRESGMLLEQGYVSAPVCSPSRAGLMFGAYQQRWGAKYFGSAKFAPDKFMTIPEILKQAGYNTGYFGKVHYGPDKPGDRSNPDKHGFDESFYGLAALGFGRLDYLQHEFNAKEKYGEQAVVHNKFTLYENGNPVECHNFLTYEFADRTMKFIEDQKNSENPYFCMLTFNAVHNFTWQLPKEELEKRGLPIYEDFNPDEVEYVDWYDGVIMPNLPNGRKYYLAQLELMDEKIGEVLDKIEELGQSENTLIIYMTDNGGSPCNYGNNSPLTGTKYTLFEGGIRVPFIASWKNVIKPNSISLNLSSSLDLLSTFAYLADAKIPECNYNDGVNLIPTLLGEKGGHDLLYFDTGFQYAVRDNEWKFIGNDTEESKKAREELLKIEHADIGSDNRLYNILENVNEDIKFNKIAENQSKVDELLFKFNEWKKDIDESKNKIENIHK